MSCVRLSHRSAPLKRMTHYMLIKKTEAKVLEFSSVTVELLKHLFSTPPAQFYYGQLKWNSRNFQKRGFLKHKRQK